MSHLSHKTRRTLRYSVFDGCAYSAMAGLTQDYIVPFALALKATTTQIGVLTSVPNLAMALSQLAAPTLTRRAGSRKGLILPAVMLQALLWAPVLALPYLIASHQVWWLVAFVTLNTVCGALGNPAWGSMMADLVPEGLRGRYFGFRGKVCGLVALAFALLGGVVLHLSPADIMRGFALMFGAAVLFRLVSWCFLARMHEPRAGRPGVGDGSIAQVVRELRRSVAGRFMVYVSLISFATHLSGPFFAVYMLRDLGFGYLTYVGILATAALSNLFFLTFWGRRSDRAGNIKVLKITSCLIPLMPLLWVAHDSVVYLLPVQVLSGFAWAGFNLASANFLYDAAKPAQRTRYLAVFNAMNGVAISLGALAGGLLAPRLPALLGFNLLTLFLVSGLARAVVVATLLRSVSEVRHVPELGMDEVIFGKGEMGLRLKAMARSSERAMRYAWAGAAPRRGGPGAMPPGSGGRDGPGAPPA